MENVIAQEESSFTVENQHMNHRGCITVTQCCKREFNYEMCQGSEKRAIAF